MIHLHPNHRSLHTLFFMGSKHLLLKCNSPPCALTISSSSFLHHHLLHTHHHHQHLQGPQPLFFSPLLSSSKPISSKILPPFASTTSARGLWSTSLSRAPPTTDRTDDDEIDHRARLLASLKQKLEQLGIRCATARPAQNTHLMCPKCGGGSTMERSLSLFISADCNTAMWNCHRGSCEWKDKIKAEAVEGVSASFGGGGTIVKHRKITEKSIGLEPLCEELLEYFMARKITAETLRRNAVMQKSGDEVRIAFTYKRNGVLVSCKYRSVNKVFWQEKNTERILYGLDDIKQVSDIIIVEGEMDKLSMEEAGFRNCVSVPDGAPSKVSNKDLPPKLEDTKYQYLWNCKEYFDKASRIILATDADQPGQALAEELARRLGRERCWRVKWPMKNEVDAYKDANEVLMYLGPHALREVIDQAELYPIRGLFNFSAFSDEIKAYYYGSMRYERGVSTGWTTLDDFYNVVPGELTVVTGVPSSGKSEWIDALLCNINENKGWRFALCSMENNVLEHGRKLMEKHIKKPLLDAKYAESDQKMGEDDVNRGIQWLDDTFCLIRCEDDCLPSVKWVLDLAKAAVLRHGVRGLVIDPYNELDHQRPSNQTETEYVSQMLTQIKRFAQHHKCHVWFVAHPRQLQNWTGDAPTLYDISGSAHFINKCDNGIVIHRNRDPAAGPIDQVKIRVLKVRNKVAGKIGDALLSYCRVTGEYKDVKDQINGSR